MELVMGRQARGLLPQRNESSVLGGRGGERGNLGLAKKMWQHKIAAPSDRIILERWKRNREQS